jgi:hypothetical protein
MGERSRLDLFASPAELCSRDVDANTLGPLHHTSNTAMAALITIVDA